MLIGKTRTLALVLLAAAIIGISFYFFSHRSLQVQVASEEQNLAIQVFGLGTVEGQTVASIGFEVGAAIAELTADQGNAVSKGKVLARLQSSQQEARVARARANLQVAETTATRSEAMISKQAAVLAQKEDIHLRQQSLARRSVVSDEKAGEASKDFIVARADLALAKTDAAVARAAVATAKADLAYEMATLDNYSLHAPFDGIVVERMKELGTVLKAGDPVFVLADPASIWILAYVDEARAGQLAVGQIAEVRLRSLAGKVFKGHVSRIGIESDRVSEERRVWVKCDDCPADFHLGEQAEVHVTVAELAQALMVPEFMVSADTGLAGKAWIASNGTAHLVDVGLGHRSLDGRVEIATGIPQGAALITGPATGITEGRAVSVAAANAK